MIYRFGTFEADTESGELQKRGVRVKLQEQPFQLLVFLLENAGDVVSRESVRHRLWPADTFVDFDASLSVAVRKLRDALGDNADSPLFVETIPKRGYRFIAPVQKENAPAPIDEPAVTRVSPDPPPLPVADKVQSVGSRTWQVLAGATVLALVLLFAVRFFRHRPQPANQPTIATAAPPVRRSIAVLGFRNLPKRKEDDWLSQAFTEMLGTELSADGTLRLVSDEDVARTKRDLSLNENETLSKQTLERLRKTPGADLVVAGSYATLPGKEHDRIRLDVRLQDTMNGETVAETAVTGEKDDLFEIASRAGSDLRKSLGVKQISSRNQESVRASLPSNQDAVQYYSEGRAKLWAFDFAAARDLLAKAVKSDPQFPLSHAALGDALWHLGHLSESVEESKQAVALSGSLPEEERLAVEASYHAGISDWAKAVDVYAKLFRLHPDSLEYGLKLAGAQFHFKAPDALATLKALRALPPPIGDDPRIDLLEASAQMTQDLDAAEAAARRALAKGLAQGSPLIVARAYGLLCQQDASHGAPVGDNLSDCEYAVRSYAAAGDLNNEARTRNDLAGTYFRLGDLPKAESIWRAAQAQFRKLSDVSGLAASSNNLGDALMEQGELRAAKKELEECLPQYVASGDKSGVALALNDLADLETRRGNLAAAEAYLERGKAMAAEVDDKSAMAYVIEQMGAVGRERAEYAQARELYNQSRALRTQTGEKQAVSESDVALAELSIDEGQPAAGEALVRQADASFIEQKEADDQLAAETVLIRALTQQGKTKEALAQIQSTEAVAAKSHSMLVLLQFALESARAELAAKRMDEARSNFQKTATTAHIKEFVPLELESRIELAKLKKPATQNPQANIELTSLRKIASERHLMRIANQTSAAPESLSKN